MLVADGSNGSPILAPYKPPRANYAVEASVRIDNTGGCSAFDYFAVVARLTEAGYYNGVYTWDCGPRAHMEALDTHNMPTYYVNDIASFTSTIDPGHGWHTYRMAVQDNQITFSVDGVVVARAIDNRYLGPGQVGLKAGNVQVSVRSLRVLVL